MLSIERVREREPNIRGIAALFSPTGAIVDSHALTRALAEDAERLGVTVSLGQEVRGVNESPGEIQLTTARSKFSAQLVVNCAGSMLIGWPI